MKEFYDIDLVLDNSVELKNVMDTDDPVISTEYKLKNIKSYICDNIADIEADLKIVVLYKGDDCCVKWNEQAVCIQGNSILEQKYEHSEVKCEVLHVKRVSGSVVDSSIYKQKIYICLRVFPICHKKEEKAHEIFNKAKKKPKDIQECCEPDIECFENEVKSDEVPIKEESNKVCRPKKDKKNKKERKKKQRKAEINENNAADMLISVLKNKDKNYYCWES